LTHPFTGIKYIVLIRTKIDENEPGVHMTARTTNFEEIIKETGIPRGSFSYWCYRAGVSPIGPPYQKPGKSFLVLDYPADAIEKIKKIYKESMDKRLKY